MPLDELFPNSTVKQVIFQIKYPNLFYIESKIGEFQLKIIDQFPESAMIIQRPLLFADVGSESKIEIDKLGSGEGAKKIWRFTSPKNFDLHVHSDSLDITSRFHKTYNNAQSDVKFRDIIGFVTSRFFELMMIPLITRIGLRYIDEFPLATLNNETYDTHVNSGVNFGRFELAQASEMNFNIAMDREGYSFRYAEAIQKNGDQFNVILDFDAFSRSVDPSNCLTVTDKLHDAVIAEFQGTIKEPVYQYMRRT